MNADNYDAVIERFPEKQTPICFQHFDDMFGIGQKKNAFVRHICTFSLLRS